LSYVIETLQYTDDKTITSPNVLISVPFSNSIKLLLWTFQYNYYINQNNDVFNFTDNPYIKIIETRKYKTKIHDNSKKINTLSTLNNSLVSQETITFNGQEIISKRNYNFFNYVEPLYYLKKTLDEGINLYSFCIDPANFRETGSFNADTVGNVKINATFKNSKISNGSIICKIYGLGYGVLEFENGASNMKFSKINK